MRRRPLLAFPALLAAPGLTAGRPARAQEWRPGGPVRLVVPFPPGAGVDAVGRTVAEAAQPAFGQTVLVENRPGAGTLIATQAVQRLPPDGQVALLVANSFVANPSLHRPPPYDPVRDFQPLALLVETPHVLTVHPGVAATLPEFLAKARQPGPGLSFASSGQGTSLHLGAEHLKLMAGLNATHVPYRGTPQVLTDLLSGRLDFIYGNLPDVLPLVREGKLVALGLAAPRRNPNWPELPTLGEQGFPDAISDSWYGLVMPANPRPEVAAAGTRIWLEALAQPTARTRLAGMGYDILGGDAAGLAARIRRDVTVYAEIVRAANLTPG